MPAYSNLLPYLKDPNPIVRSQTVKSLEKSGDKSVIPTLIQVLLTDGVAYVRHSAAAAFQRKLADPSAVSALEKTLIEDEDLYVRGAAAAALGIIKDRRAVPYLCKALKDESDHVRWASAFPLGQIGDRSAVPALRKLLDDPQEVVSVKDAAAIALKQLEKIREV
ncbi:MAG: HEAT repeat domain-containing protein [Candidatus Omnitrophica bacterium]|nr:HEAT repeat domain-containing protein [Candidatus Omnitrophota bacterium]